MIAVSYGAVKTVPLGGFTHMFGLFVACIPPLILLVSVLFLVKGYEVDGRKLRICRLLWSTDVSLEDLKYVHHDPVSVKCSKRIFGNAGLYSFTGIYENKILGRFRLFGTDIDNSVVLSFPHRMVVITLEKPTAFIHFLLQYFPNVREGASQKK